VGTAVIEDGMLRIAMENAPAAMGSIALYDLMGRTVLDAPAMIDGDAVSVEIGGLPRGIYFGRMRVGGMVREFQVR
jgi:hypothetical protein